MGQYYKFCNINTKEINGHDIDLGGYKYHEGKNLHAATENEIKVIFGNVATDNDWAIDSIVSLGDYGTLIYFNADNKIKLIDLDKSLYADTWLKDVWTDEE